MWQLPGKIESAAWTRDRDLLKNWQLPAEKGLYKSVNLGVQHIESMPAVTAAKREMWWKKKRSAYLRNKSILNIQDLTCQNPNKTYIYTYSVVFILIPFLRRRPKATLFSIFNAFHTLRRVSLFLVALLITSDIPAVSLLQASWMHNLCQDGIQAPQQSIPCKINI